MVSTIVPVENTEKRNNMQMYKEKHCGIGNTYIRQILKDCNIKPEQINCKKTINYKEEENEKNRYFFYKKNNKRIKYRRNEIKLLYTIQ